MNMSDATAAHRRQVQRIARIHSERLGRETLLHRSEFLHDTDRALINAHLHLGITVRQLALLHRVSPRQMRRRIERLRESLSDPCFLLAARHAGELPGDLPSLAREYWIDGRTLRELACTRHESLHRIRQQIGTARSCLLFCMSAAQAAAKRRAAEPITYARL